MFSIFRKEKGKLININDIDALIGKINLIDVREPLEYKNGSLESSKNIPMNTLIKEPSKYLKNDEEYYIMCQSGGRSSRTCSILKKQGYNVINVAGGIGAYLGNKRK